MGSKGTPRVDGDEEEDGYDDLDNEFELGNHGTRENPLSLSVEMLSSPTSVASGSSSISGFATPSEVDVAGPNPDIPLLTYDQADDSSHALIVPPYMDRARRVHPMQLLDTASSVSFPPRPMDPKRDLAVYGYGTVAWKDKMEEWRKRQINKLEMVSHQGDGAVVGHAV